MSLQRLISDSVARAIRLPEGRMEEERMVELAVGLYAKGALSFGKARELAGMGKYEFARLLGERDIPRHFGKEELVDDLVYARGE